MESNEQTMEKVKKPGKVPALLWAVLVLAIYYLISLGISVGAGMIAGMSMTASVGYDMETYEQKFMEFVQSTDFLMRVNILCQVADVVVFGLWYYLKFVRKCPAEVRERVKTKAYTGKALLTGILLGVGGQGASSMVVAIITMIDPARVESFNASMESNFDLSSPFGWLAIVLLAPLAEELVFRGLALNKLRKAWGAVGCIVITAIMFAAVHGNLVQILYVFPCALVLGYVGYRYESIVPGLIMHLVNNLLSCLSIPESIVIYLAMMVVGFAAAAVLNRKEFRNEEGF